MHKKYPELLKMVEKYTDDELWKLKVGGHDPAKVYALSLLEYQGICRHPGFPHRRPDFHSVAALGRKGHAGKSLLQKTTALCHDTRNIQF